MWLPNLEVRAGERQGNCYTIMSMKFLNWLAMRGTINRVITTDRACCLIIGAFTEKSSFIGKIEGHPCWTEIIHAQCMWDVSWWRPEPNDVRNCRLSAVRPSLNIIRVGHRGVRWVTGLFPLVREP